MSQGTGDTALQVGGAVRPGVLYVAREADTALPEALSRGELCTVLAPRQIGKSSLRVRAAARLRALGLRVASVDLSGLGSAGLDPEAWFYGLCCEVAAGLDLEDPQQRWAASAGRPPAARWLAFLEAAVVRGSGPPVVLFLDEIDAVLALPFGGEDLFASLRAAWDRRAEDPAWARLTVALLGVAAPADLISDPRRTPFNVGRAVRIDDFSPAEARALLPVLADVGGDAEALLGAVLAWSHGHPFQTAQICAALADQREAEAPAEHRVHAVVRQLYFGTWPDPSLEAAGRALRESASPEQLALYRRVLSGRGPPWDPRERCQADLLLSGLVAHRDGRLVVRNAVVAAVYDLPWIEAAQGRRALRQRAWAWAQRGRLDADLATGEELDALRRTASRREDLDREEAEFLLRAEAAVAARAAGRRARRLWALAAALALVGVVAAGAAGLRAREARWLRMAQGAADIYEFAQIPGQQSEALRRALTAWWDLRGTPFAAQSTRSLAETLEAVRSPRLGTGGAWSVAWLPGGDLFVGRKDGRLERLKADRSWAPPLALGSAPSALAVSPDASALLVGMADGAVLVLDVGTGRSRGAAHTLHAPRQVRGCFSFTGEDFELAPGVRRAVIAPDGTLGLTVGAEGGAQLWRLSDGGPLGALPVAGAFDALFSPDSRQIAVAGRDGQVRVFRVADLQLLWARGPFPGTQADPNECEEERGDLDALLGLASAPGAAWFAVVGRHGVAQLLPWDGLADGRALQHLGLSVRNVAVAPDGQRVATGTEDGAVYIWDAPSGQLLHQHTDHRQSLTALRFSADGRLLASASSDDATRLWDPRSGQLVWTAVHGDGTAVNLAFSPDGSYLAVAADGSLLRYAVGPAAALDIWPVPARGRPSGLAVSPRGEVAVGWTGGRALVLAPGGGRDESWPVPEEGVVSARFSPDGESLAWSSTRETWVVRRGEALPEPVAGGAVYWANPWSPDGQRLALSHGHEGRIAGADGHPIATLDTKIGPGPVFSPDGRRVLAVLEGGGAGLFDAQTGRLESRLGGPGRTLIATAWSADGRRVAVVGWEGLLLADAGGASRGMIDMKGGGLWAAWVGEQLWTAQRNGPIRLWDSDGRLQLTLLGHSGTMRSVDLSSDHRRLVSSAEEGDVHLWSDRGESLAVWHAHRGVARAVAFSADGQSVISAGDDGQVYRLPGSAEALVGLACSWLEEEGLEALPACLNDVNGVVNGVGP